MKANSTNVRTNAKLGSSRKPTSKTAWLGHLAKLDPRLAARLGAHWFTRPRRWPRPEREQRLLAAATPLVLKGGMKAWSFGAGPLVLLVHGWEGRGAQLGAFVEPLVDRGFRVVAFDVQAHGSSPGTHATILSWITPLLELSERFGEPVCSIGHSFGCPAISLAIERGYRTRSLVYLAPPDALEGGVRSFARVTGIGERGEAALKNLLAARTKIRFEDQRVENFGAKMTAPLLVVHDADDVDVPLRCARSYARHWPGCSVFTTSGLGHRKILRDATVVDRVVTFVEGHRTNGGALDRWLDAALSDRPPRPSEHHDQAPYEAHEDLASALPLAPA